MYDGHGRKGPKHGYDHYYQSDFRPDYRMKDLGLHRDDRENHVLLITVINPAFPITCDIIQQICSPYGRVLRVVIFKKNGVQAMVELDSVDSARCVKNELHGRDIYTDCCTLRVEYAKPTRLNVYKNDSESFDFTKPSLGKNKKPFHPPDLNAPRNWVSSGPSQEYAGQAFNGSSNLRPPAPATLTASSQGSGQAPSSIAAPSSLPAPQSVPPTATITTQGQTASIISSENPVTS